MFISYLNFRSIHLVKYYVLLTVNSKHVRHLQSKNHKPGKLFKLSFENNDKSKYYKSENNKDYNVNEVKFLQTNESELHKQKPKHNVFNFSHNDQIDKFRKNNIIRFLERSENFKSNKKNKMAKASKKPIRIFNNKSKKMKKTNRSQNKKKNIRNNTKPKTRLNKAYKSNFKKVDMTKKKNIKNRASYLPKSSEKITKMKELKSFDEVPIKIEISNSEIDYKDKALVDNFSKFNKCVKKTGILFKVYEMSNQMNAITAKPVYVTLDRNSFNLYAKTNEQIQAIKSISLIDIFGTSQSFKNSNCFDINSKEDKKSPVQTIILCSETKEKMHEWNQAIEDFKLCGVNVNYHEMSFNFLNNILSNNGGKSNNANIVNEEGNSVVDIGSKSILLHFY